MNITKIKKRNGQIVDFKPEALMKWAKWAAIHGCDWFEIVTDAYRRCPDKCTTKELHLAMIQACIDKETIPHLMMAGRLLIGDVYKQAYGGHKKIPSVKEQFKKMVGLGLYEPMDYTDEELDSLETVIDHSLDKKIIYSALKQIADKYLIRDVINNRVLESPQHAWMRMALGVMQAMPKERRMNDVVTEYKILSSGKNNVPTPFMVNMGTPKKAYASCCTSSTKDTAASLAAANHIEYMMTVASAGQGSHIKTRSKGDGVRVNTIKHAGKLPYYRASQAMVQANLQGCYSEDTEILTNNGFKLFSDLGNNDLVAQVNSGRLIDFVKPLGIMAYPYAGEMFQFKNNLNNGLDLLVTPNHRMAYRQSIRHKNKEFYNESLKQGNIFVDSSHVSSKDYTIAEASQFNPHRKTIFDLSGQTMTNSGELSDWEKLCIAFQADGVKKWAGNYAYTFRFTRERKIERLQTILNNLGIEYTKSLQKTNVTSFYVKVGKPLPVNFDWVKIDKIGSEWCKQFLHELAYWDGSFSVDTKKDAITFSTTDKSVIDTIQAISCLCLATCTIYEPTKKEEHHKLRWSAYITFDKSFTSGRAIEKTSVQYGGMVYCVEVPSGVVIVRRKGKTVVCGNSRGGALTMHYNALDPEIETLLNLKNPTTVESKKINHIDYSFGYNPFFVKKAMKNEDWMLVSYSDSPELYEAFYSGVAGEFENLYNEYEKTDKPRTYVSARKIAKQFLKQAVETGRIYEHNTFWLNHHTPFNDRIYSSNLCVAPDTMIDCIIDGIPKTITIEDLTNAYNKTSNIRVLSKDIESDVHSYKKVLAAAKTDSDRELIRITDLKTNRTISLTPNHKVYTKNRGWIEAGSLVETDELDII